MTTLTPSTTSKNPRRSLILCSVSTIRWLFGLRFPDLWTFSDFESAGVQISCTVFHAEQFDALRRSCHCEQSMIESLARCVKWDVSGGKSGSAFLKSRGERISAPVIRFPFSYPKQIIVSLPKSCQGVSWTQCPSLPRNTSSTCPTPFRPRSVHKCKFRFESGAYMF